MSDVKTKLENFLNVIGTEVTFSFYSDELRSAIVNSVQGYTDILKSNGEILDSKVVCKHRGQNNTILALDIYIMHYGKENYIRYEFIIKRERAEFNEILGN